MLATPHVWQVSPAGREVRGRDTEREKGLAMSWQLRMVPLPAEQIGFELMRQIIFILIQDIGTAEVERRIQQEVLGGQSINLTSLVCLL